MQGMSIDNSRFCGHSRLGTSDLITGMIDPSDLRQRYSDSR